MRTKAYRQQARWLLALPVTVVLMTLLASAAGAHTRSQSYSKWELSGERADFVFKVDARRVTQLAAEDVGGQTLTKLLYAHLNDMLQVRQGGRDCELEQLKISGGAYSGKLSAAGSFLCPATIDADTSAHISAFMEVSPSHVHIAHIAGHDYVLTANNQEFPLLAGGEAPRSFGNFVRLGTAHVLSGADHIAFLIALLLAALTLRRIFWCITGFTLGHSLTLALVTLGVVTPKTNLIEALIGYSIALTAVEIMRTRRRLAQGHLLLAALVLLAGVSSGRLEAFVFTALLAIFGLSLNAAPRPELPVAGGVVGEAADAPTGGARWLALVATLFGLIHGAGFAGGLIELELDGADLLVPLFSFNIGVELAQLLVAIIILGVGAVAMRYLPRDGLTGSREPDGSATSSRAASGILLLISAVLFGIGVYWFGGGLLHASGIS